MNPYYVFYYAVIGVLIGALMLWAYAWTATGVAFADKTKRVDRRLFAAWTVPTSFVLVIIIYGIAKDGGGTAGKHVLFGYLLLCILFHFATRLVVYRLRDIGRPKTWAYAVIYPFFLAVPVAAAFSPLVGLLVVLPSCALIAALLLLPSAKSEPSDTRQPQAPAAD